MLTLTPPVSLDSFPFYCTRLLISNKALIDLTAAVEAARSFLKREYLPAKVVKKFTSEQLFSIWFSSDAEYNLARLVSAYIY